MRTIPASQVERVVAELCVRANMELPEDIQRALEQSREAEPWPTAGATLGVLCDNIRAAGERCLPICQDTGLACVFLELGQDMHIEGELYGAVNRGVSRGYTEGYLRKSVVADPLRRENTGDNTPALIAVDIVPGDRLRVTVAPKGAGSENMSALKMLKPSDGVEGVKRFVIDTVKSAGANACPPMVIGVGVGGSFDKAALLAKKALLRPIDKRNPDEVYAALERELLESVNALGVGPQGFGGRTTALGLNIEFMAAHVASLPVAVNISCHVTRRASAVL